MHFNFYDSAQLELELQLEVGHFQILSYDFSLQMPYSHHSHSGQFCKHATGSLEEVVLEAIRQNFRVYGLSEHVPRYRVDDLYPEEVW